VRVLGVVPLSPFFGDGLGFEDRMESVSVEKLVSYTRVKRLDKWALRRFAWLNEEQLDAVFVGPRFQRRGDVVQANSLAVISPVYKR
jgi:hypothetical protein